MISPKEMNKEEVQRQNSGHTDKIRRWNTAREWRNRKVEYYENQNRELQDGKRDK